MGEFVVIKVEDNGVGMDQEQIQKILGGKIDETRRSFGLIGTIERSYTHLNIIVNTWCLQPCQPLEIRIQTLRY